MKPKTKLEEKENIMNHGLASGFCGVFCWFCFVFPGKPMAKPQFLGKSYGSVCSSNCITVFTNNQIKVLP